MLLPALDKKNNKNKPCVKILLPVRIFTFFVTHTRSRVQPVIVLPPVEAVAAGDEHAEYESNEEVPSDAYASASQPCMKL